MKLLVRTSLGLALLLVAFGLGRCSSGASEESAPVDASDSEQAASWICPMHPQIRLPEFGPCPICGMDLVPMTTEAGEAEERLTLSLAAKELANVATAPVERRAVERSVRMVGKLDYDETAMKTISARVPGRLERLFVDYVGLRVQAGDHLVWLYSPELLSAQEELLAARGRLDGAAQESSEFLASSARRAHRSARDKLKLFGLTELQVDEIEARGTAEDHVLVTSPVSGVVVEKALDEGAYVEVGTRIYGIADLNRLWVQLDAYEQDLPWLHFGQAVRFETEAHPGESFEGKISFLSPVVDERTRTVAVRVHVENPSGKLKPGMFVRATARARIAASGRVEDRSLAGKWVSPMHPEVVKDAAGECDVCGMELVPAEELGLVATGEGSGLPLVVPASAVLWTGKRAVVYVAVPDVSTPTYEYREVRLGARADEAYVVRDGLAEGERVVVQGAFRIDSAMQIRGKPSMMSVRPESAGAHEHARSEATRERLAPVVESYTNLQQRLARDDAAGARAAFSELATSLAEGKEWPAQARMRISSLAQLVSEGAAGEDVGLEALRRSFEAISRVVIELLAEAHNPLRAELVRVHCPMAFDFEGADWVQLEGEVQNPYFGAEMLRCGTVQTTFEGH